MLISVASEYFTDVYIGLFIVYLCILCNLGKKPSKDATETVCVSVQF